MDIFEIIRAGEYLLGAATLLGAVYTVMVVTQSVIQTFSALQAFLGEDVPQMGRILTSIEDYAERGITNHLTHIQTAVETMAQSLGTMSDQMVKQTQDLHDHELKDAEVQSRILDKLSEL